MRLLAILLLVATAGIAAVGCGKSHVMSSSMSDKDKDTLRANLAKLEDTLQNKSPFVANKLAPGATQQEIDGLRSELGGVQIECLEVWYRWHNGCSDRLTDILPLGRMLSIAEALEDRKAIQSIPFVDAKRKVALKILDDGAGDGFFLDVESTNPRVFYHMLEDPYPRDFGTLDEFVNFINDVHATGSATRNEHGMVSFVWDHYQKMEVEYLQRIRKAE